MKTKNLSKRKKVLSFFTLFLLIFSVFSASYSDASDKDDKIYIIVTGFTHIWGHAQNPATDTYHELMPFTAANYNIVNRGQIYDYDGKKVTVGFGNSFKDGNKGLDLSYIDDVYPIKDAKAYLYDPSLSQIESSRWTTALDPQNGKNVGFNETTRAQGKMDYEEEYFARNTNPSAITSSYNQSTKKISFYQNNTVPSFSSLGSDINAFNQRVVRLDHLARRNYAEVNELMIQFSGPEWETYYPDVRARLMEAASNTPASRTLRGYMFFTSYIVEIELEGNAELAMADTIFQNERTSFTDGSGTLRDKLEVYDMDGVQVMGDTLNPGQRYRMCSYILNAGTTDTTREVLPEFYMVKNDVRNFTIPNHMKENLGTSQANQADIRASLPVDRMGTFCKEFDTPTDVREIRVESRIPSSYIPLDDTRETNNFAMRIFRLQGQDLAYDDIFLTGSLVPNSMNTFSIRMCKVEGNKEVERVFTRIWATNRAGTMVHDSVRASTNSVKDPSDCVVYNVPINVNDNQIRVCARIDARHHAAGENDILGNDEGCRTFAVERDFFVSNFHISPNSIKLDPVRQTEGGFTPNPNPYNGTFTFSFDVNLAAGSENTSYTVPARIRDMNGNIIYTENVTLRPGESRRVTFSRNYSFNPGRYPFEASVNWPFVVPEFSSAADPYLNNRQTQEISIINDVEPHKPLTCSIQSADSLGTGFTSSKSWTGPVPYTVREIHGYLVPKTCDTSVCDKDGKNCYTEYYDCSYCVTTSDKTWTEPSSHSQSYSIKSVEFRSKYTKDAFLSKTNRRSNVVGANEGWVEMGSSPGDAKVRAGSGYEIRVTLEYYDDLATTCACGPVYCPWSSTCSSGSRSPGIPSRGPSPKDEVKITFPGEAQIVASQPQISRGCANNSAKEFTQVFTFDGSNQRGTGAYKKRFVPETASHGQIFDIRITTDLIPGAQGPGIPETELCDEGVYRFQVDGHFSHDFITQIVQ